ncbi:MAG: radical SAM protein, partial [bacterium]
MTDFKHLFGPVPSRRLGVSLGVDFIPAKTCSLDCVYCESGPTTNLSTERCKFISPDEITAELDSFLSTKPSIDYITFSGAGEPTLYSGLGQINDFIKKNYPGFKTALLTNGTLLWREDVRKECYGIDLVFPSIDAGSEEIFKKINRPEESLHIKKVLGGIREFSLNYKGSLWIEVFVLPGINITEKALGDIKSAISEIPHEKIFLNTLDRPGSESGLKKASSE